jgi:hypothetical protein
LLHIIPLRKPKELHVSQNNSDSVADAWAIFALIAIVVATAVFWVSNH